MRQWQIEVSPLTIQLQQIRHRMPLPKFTLPLKAMLPPKVMLPRVIQHSLLSSRLMVVITRTRITGSLACKDTTAVAILVDHGTITDQALADHGTIVDQVSADHGTTIVDQALVDHGTIIADQVSVDRGITTTQISACPGETITQDLNPGVTAAALAGSSDNRTWLATSQAPKRLSNLTFSLWPNSSSADNVFAL